MRVSTMVRTATALALAAGGLAACSDSTSAPARAKFATGGATLDRNEPGHDRGESGHGKNNTRNSSSAQYTVDPTRPTTLNFGEHTVTFPAGSICDPATSGYGESLWDAPCTPLRSPLVISATWSETAWHSYIDFQPALRFVPTSDPSHWVVLSMKEKEHVIQSYRYFIAWQRPSDGVWINEGLSDPTMSTSADDSDDRITRRLKHFSGYTVAATSDSTLVIGF